MKIAIIVSNFNSEITDNMLQDALTEIKKHKHITADVYNVPGVVELPLAAKLLAEKSDHAAIILLGCVIKGETDHYEYVCSQVSHGCQQIMLEYGLPVIFGVLTTRNSKQALERSNGVKGYKGRYCVDAAIQMIELKNKILD